MSRKDSADIEDDFERNSDEIPDESARKQAPLAKQATIGMKERSREELISNDSIEFDLEI